MKKFKVPLIQTAAGILCMVLAVPFKSLVLLIVSIVLIWIGVNGAIKVIGEKK